MEVQPGEIKLDSAFRSGVQSGISLRVRLGKQKPKVKLEPVRLI